MYKSNTLLTCSFFFFIQMLQAQISFTNRNDLLTTSDFHSGVAMGVTDMNRDGKDDIVRMNQGYQLVLEFQNQVDQVFTTLDVGNVDNDSQWSMCVADVDNNGYNDVLAGGAYDNVKIALSNVDGTNYTTTFLPSSTIFTQGSNFVDINNDGHLDVFTCHDDAESRIWGNDGMGNLVMQDDWIDMATTPTSENGGNYGSIWTDFDNDGDLDLYIAKCRSGVTDPTDPERINALFVNDGNGNFTEEAEAFGLKIGWQSWTSDFQDVNNDGHLDCFITNHDHASQLMINDGTGHFVEAENTGINVVGQPVQGVMRDFDNDGFVDILVAGTNQHLFRNNGNLTFTEVSGIFDTNDLESFALGDLNSDGFVDVYGGYAGLYTSPSDIDDVLWMNNGNNNNHLTVNLEGVVSNRSAIGARIEIFGEWGIQVREVRSGESYGIMNSMIQYFGLGTATAVDSVRVKWPSGLVQVETSVSINSTLQLLEGGCVAATPDLEVVGETIFCNGESITINAPAGYESYLWSTGETTPTIQVESQGSFAVTVTNAAGCFGFSNSVVTVVDPPLSPMIEAQDVLSFCEGKSVTLMETANPQATNIVWSNGAAGSSIEVTESGTYSATVSGLCSDFVSSSITVEVWDAGTLPMVTGDTVAVGTPAELTAVGTDLRWYEEATGGTPLAAGNNFMTSPILVSDTFFVENVNVIEPFEIATGGMENFSGTNAYSGDQNANNQIVFDASRAFRLDSVKVYTDLAGARKVLVMNEAFQELNSVIVEIPEGESVIHLGLDIPAGTNLFLTTDAMTNFDSLGMLGPRLQRSNSNVTYPYELSDVVSLKRSNFGTQWYYYFFDWKITIPEIGCASERVPVIALLETDVVATIDFGKSEAVNVFPNPSDGEVTLELKFERRESVQLRITDMTGKLVLENEISGDKMNLDLEDFVKGVYAVQVIHGGDVYVGKVVLR